MQKAKEIYVRIRSKVRWSDVSSGYLRLMCSGISISSKIEAHCRFGKAFIPRGFKMVYSPHKSGI